MKNTFKKIVASVMAVAAMAVSAVGVRASAATSTDSYSKFEWDIDGSDAYSKLTNTSGTSRYAQAVVFSYSLSGAYNGQSTPDEHVIATSSYVKSSGTPYGNSYEFHGTLYQGTHPYGTPLAVWVRTMSR